MRSIHHQGASQPLPGEVAGRPPAPRVPEKQQDIQTGPSSHATDRRHRSTRNQNKVLFPQAHVGKLHLIKTCSLDLPMILGRNKEPHPVLIQQRPGGSVFQQSPNVCSPRTHKLKTHQVFRVGTPFLKTSHDQTWVLCIFLLDYCLVP